MLLYQPRPLLFWRYYSENGNLYAVISTDVAVGINEKLSFTKSRLDNLNFQIIVTIGPTGYSQLPEIELFIEELSLGLSKVQVKAEIEANPDYNINTKINKDGVTLGEAKSTTSKSSEIEIIT